MKSASAMKTLKKSVTEVSQTSTEHVTYWHGHRAGNARLNIHVAPIPKAHCLAVLTKNLESNLSTKIAEQCKAEENRTIQQLTLCFLDESGQKKIMPSQKTLRSDVLRKRQGA
jgi:hypothetical protein